MLVCVLSRASSGVELLADRAFISITGASATCRTARAPRRRWTIRAPPPLAAGMLIRRALPRRRTACLRPRLRKDLGKAAEVAWTCRPLRKHVVAALGQGEPRIEVPPAGSKRYAALQEPLAAFHIARALLAKSSAAKGDVKHVYVDGSDPRGLVHVLFADASSANAAALALHGRWFGGRAITCAHTDPAAYNYQSLP